MRLVAYGFVTIDEILAGGRSEVHPGGPPTYAAATMSRLGGGRVTPVTMVGSDFSEFLPRVGALGLGLPRGDVAEDCGTTRFRIRVMGDRRVLRLLSRCRDPDQGRLGELGGDVLMVSPVAGELRLEEVTPRILGGYGVSIIDLQGVMRVFDEEGYVTELRYVGSPSILKMFDYVKVNSEELRSLFGVESVVEGVRRAAGLGLSILVTSPKSVYAVLPPKIYLIHVPWRRMEDNTGLGDVFVASFAYMAGRGEDPVWAACFAVASVTQCSRGMGIEKVRIGFRDAVDLADELYQSHTLL